MSERIDITGINKVELLKELWLNATVDSYFMYEKRTEPEFNEAEAAKAITSYIDCFQDRCIKLNISGDYIINAWRYDDEFGEGKVKEIVDNLRKK